jgi:copper chaperone CopZ
VSKIEGVSGVEGDPDTKKVVVDYDPARVGLDRIESTMAEEGYPVQK